MPGNPLPKRVLALALALALTLALALKALKFRLRKRLSNLHLHKVRASFRLPAFGKLTFLAFLQLFTCHHNTFSRQKTENREQRAE